LQTSQKNGFPTKAVLQQEKTFLKFAACLLRQSQPLAEELLLLTLF
jgi:hypothetical protein